MKKTIAMVLAFMMTLTLATGCSSETTSTESTTTESATTETTTTETETTESTLNADGTYAQPEGYPAETIEFIVPAAAGASLDLYVRSMNEVLDLGTPLQITNMDGGSQTIGMMEMGNRDGDGYSIGIVAFAGGIIQPQLVDVTYSMDDFRPVAVASGPNSYSICGTDVSNYEEFDALLASGETVYWTAPNSGSPAHLAGLYYLQEKGVTNCEFISYNGAAEALTALLGGDVAFYITDDSVVATQEAEGQVSGILTLSDGRSAMLPDVPSADEYGVDGMGVFDAFSWIMVPSDTPDDVYNWIKQQVDEAVTSDLYQEFLANSNFIEMRVYSEEELNGMISDATTAVAEVIALLS